MKNLDNSIFALQNLVTLIGSDEDIKRSLLIDDSNAKETPIDISSVTPQSLVEKQYIITSPIGEMPNIKNPGINVIIVIRFQSAVFGYSDRNSCQSTYVIDIASNLNTANFNIYPRALMMANSVVKAIDGKKLTSLGRLNVNEVSESIYDEDLFGYRVVVTLSDQADQDVDL